MTDTHEEDAMLLKSEAIGELSDALSAAQGEWKTAEKDNTNDFFKSRSATLASVWSVVRSPLAARKLSVTQQLRPYGEHLYLVTELTHSSNQWKRSYWPIKPVKDDP